MELFYSISYFFYKETFAREYGEMKISVIYPIFIKMSLIAGLLSDFVGEIGRIQAIFIRHTSRAKVS